MNEEQTVVVVRRHVEEPLPIDNNLVPYYSNSFSETLGHKNDTKNSSIGTINSFESKDTHFQANGNYSSTTFTEINQITQPQPQQPTHSNGHYDVFLEATSTNEQSAIEISTSDEQINENGIHYYELDFEGLQFFEFDFERLQFFEFDFERLPFPMAQTSMTDKNPHERCLHQMEEKDKKVQQKEKKKKKKRMMKRKNWMQLVNQLNLDKKIHK